MDIAGIVGSLTSRSQSGQATRQGTGEPAVVAVDRAATRGSPQSGTTEVRISAFGQIKGAFAELQVTGKALSDTNPTATTDDIKKTVVSFVDAYNKTNRTIAAATQSQGKDSAADALSTDSRTHGVGSDLSRSVTTGGTLSSLGNVGVTQNRDGSLALDIKTLDSALKSNPDQVRATLAEVGNRIEKTAANELDSNGNTGASVNSLSKRNADLAAQQSAQQDRQIAAQRLLDRQNAQINNVFATGLVAYQRTFSG